MTILFSSWKRWEAMLKTIMKYLCEAIESGPRLEKHVQ